MKSNNLGIFPLILGLALGLNLSGCAVNSHRLQPGDTPATVKVDTLADWASKGRADIELRKKGELLLSRKISLSPDSLSIHTARGQVDTTLALRDVRSITFRNHSKGATQGLATGFLAGAAAGIIGGLMSGDDEDGFVSGFGGEGRTVEGTKAGTKAAVGGVLLGAVGGLLGLVVGGMAGAPEIFLLPEPAAVDTAGR